MRAAEVAQLAVQLRGSRRTAQLRAAARLAALAEASGEAQCAVVAAGGVIGPLVQLLRSGRAAEQEQAARALSCWCDHSASIRGAVAAEGGIKAVVPLLRSSTPAVQQQAVQLLAVLTYDPSRYDAIIAAGSIPPLLQMCRGSSGSGSGSSSSSGDGGGDGAVLPAAVVALANLCGAESCNAAMAAAGGVEVLAAMLSSDRPTAVKCFCNLLADSDELAAAITAAGAAPTLVQALRSSPDAEEQHAAFAAIVGLVRGSEPASCAAVTAAGGPAALVEHLAINGHADAHMQELAAIALRGLAVRSAQRCTAIASAGCVPHLVRLVESGLNAKVHLAAVGALYLLAGSSSPTVAAAVVAAGGIPALRQLLGSSQDPATIWTAAGAVYMLAAHGQYDGAAAASTMATLERLLSSPDANVREGVSEAIRALKWSIENPEDAAAAAAGTAAAPAGAEPQLHGSGVQTGCGLGQPAAALRLPRVCAAPGCGSSANLRRCGGCGAVRYCSEACSRAHWRTHKAECRRLQAEKAAAAGQPDGH